MRAPVHSPFSAIVNVVVVVVALALLCSAPSPAGAAKRSRGAKGASGGLYLKKYVPDHQLAEFKGFMEPRLFVYDDEGNPLPSKEPGGGYRPGELVALPGGWYQVEVGEYPTELNRWRYYVKPGQTTLVRSGLVVLPTTPRAEQGADPLCQPWRAEFHAHVWDNDGNMKLIISNSETPVEDFGMLQLHEGPYAFAFNKLFTVQEVKAEKTLALPTASVGPLPNTPYRLSMRADDKAETPSIVLCKDHSTQILAGEYVGSYYIDTMAPPFRKRVWEPQFVDAGSPRYKRAPKDAGARGKRFWRGEGSKPTRVVPLTVENPLPKP